MRATERSTRRHTRAALAIVAVGIPFLFLLWHAGSFLVVSRDLATPDAIVVLASHEWERLPEVARVAQRNPRATILLTQPVVPTDRNCAHCASRASWLRAIGVASNPIVLMPRRVTNTYDEAVATREYAARAHYGRVLIVTSPYHTRRALATFSTVFAGTGVNIGIRPALRTSIARPDAWLLGGYDRWYVPYEWIGLGWYAVRHGVW
jgi:uncharacterized SAM-binding protein YcdF (DUF218 family)